MKKHLLFTFASPLVAAYSPDEFITADYEYQMNGFLQGFIGKKLNTDVNHDCMVPLINKNKFKTAYNEVISYAQDSSLQYDASVIALRMHSMILGLFDGMSHSSTDGHQVCTYD